MSSLATFSTATKARLRAVYSDFTRQKTSNPTSYASNLQWWSKALEEVTSTGILTVNLQSGTPWCSTSPIEGALLNVELENNPISRLVLYADATMRKMTPTAVVPLVGGGDSYLMALVRMSLPR